jgi:hypothetical protein
MTPGQGSRKVGLVGASGDGMVERFARSRSGYSREVCDILRFAVFCIARVAILKMHRYQKWMLAYRKTTGARAESGYPTGHRAVCEHKYFRRIIPHCIKKSNNQLQYVKKS